MTKREITIRGLGPVGSSTTGAGIALDFITMSIGFSKTVDMEFIFSNSRWLAGAGDFSGPCNAVSVLIACAVISANGVLSRCCGSGDMDGAGVGSEGFNSGVSGAIDVRLGLEAILCRLRGDALLDGDEGTSGVAVSSGSNICEGSMFSLCLVLRVLVLALDEAVTSAIVLRRLSAGFRGLLFGAGVNSSSSSSSSTVCFGVIASSSDSSTITFLLAALRDGRVGDIEDILLSCSALPSMVVSIRGQIDNYYPTRSWSTSTIIRFGKVAINNVSKFPQTTSASVEKAVTVLYSSTVGYIITYLCIDRTHKAFTSLCIQSQPRSPLLRQRLLIFSSTC